MPLDLTNDQWNEFAIGLDAALTEILTRLESVEAWMCRRPNDAIPQVFIDQIRAEAIVEADPQPEGVPSGEDSDLGVPNGE